MNRLRDLLVDGVLLLLPLALVAVLLYQVVTLLAKVLRPTAALLPQAGWLGVAVVDLLVALVLLLLVLAAGSFARSRAGRRASSWTERLVLEKIPGFQFYKSMVSGFSSEQRESGVTPALVALNDRTVLAFIIENADAATGMVTVFVPATPTPAVGTVMLVEQSRVTPLDVSVTAAMQVASQFGLGLQQLSCARARC